MEFILLNQNWFYLLGIIYIIKNIFSIINRKKYLSDKKVSKFDFAYVILVYSWMIYGLSHTEKIFFAVLLFFSAIIPTLLQLSGLEKSIQKTKDTMKLPNFSNGEALKDFDFVKHVKFYNLLSIIEIFVVIGILVNHFKITLFYLLS